ncbi:MAG: hypothetical protein ACOVOD_05530, partial [Rhodoferax sp.]
APHHSPLGRVPGEISGLALGLDVCAINRHLSLDATLAEKLNGLAPQARVNGRWQSGEKPR